MKLKICVLFILLSPVSLMHVNANAASTPTATETPVAKDSNKVCEDWIKSYKSALQAVIDGKATDDKQNIDEAKTQLAHINRLPNSLTPCEKQREIPAFQNDETLSQ